MLPLLAATLAATSLSAPRPLDEARQLYRSMRFKAVVEVLEPVCAQPSLTQADRREAVDLYARSLAAAGRLDESEAAWVRLLEKDPDAPAPAGVAPKIAAAFERAQKRAVPPAPPPEPEPEPPVVITLAPQRPPPPPPAPQIVAPPPEPFPARLLGFSLAASSGAIFAVGLGLVLSSQAESAEAQRALRAVEARMLDDRAMRSAITGDVLVALAVCVAVTAAVFFWRGQ